MAYSSSGGQASSSQGYYVGATSDGLLNVLGGEQSSSQHPVAQVMGDSGAAYIAQLNAVCQFLRQEGFVQAERQLLQELEQKFPSIGKLSPEEEEEEAGRQAHHAAQEAHAATAARPDLLEPQQHSQYQQHPAHTAGGGLGSQPPFPFPPPPARPQARLRPPHKIPKQKVPWGPDVDEYQSIEDVGYIRKDISGQQQFEELELLGSDLSEEPEGMATASGPLSSQRDDDYEGSSGGHGEGSEGEEEEEQGSSQGGGDVASLSETEDLGTRHMQQQQQQQRSSSFQSPASSTLELHPAGRWSAPGEQGSSDPTWDMGPQDIKLTEPVSTPSKGSGDQQQLSGENSRPVLSRVESLSSSLKDFDADRSHEQGESMASGPMSRAHSDSEQQPPELGGGEVIDFNPIPLAQATPQDLKAFGLHEQQQQGAKQQQQQQHDPAAFSAVTSSLAVGVGSRAQHAPQSEDPEAGATASPGATTPGRESNKSLEQAQSQADAREPGGGFSFPVTPKQSDEPQSHPPPFKSWPSVRSSFTSEFAAASDDDHNAADYADEDYSKSVSASKSGSRSTSQNLGAHMRKLDLNGSRPGDEDASGVSEHDQWKSLPSKLSRQQQSAAAEEGLASPDVGPSSEPAPLHGHSAPAGRAPDISNVGPTFYGGAFSIGKDSPKSNSPARVTHTAPGEQEKAGQPSSSSSSSTGEAKRDRQAREGRGAGAAEEAAGSKSDPSQAQQAAEQGSPMEYSPYKVAGGGSAMPSRSPVMVLAAATSGSPGSDGRSNEDATQASPKASESVHSASQLTLAPLAQEEGMEGPGGQPEVVAHMVDHLNETSSSSQQVEGDGEGDGATSVLRRQVPRSGSEAGGSEGGPDDTEMREAEAHIADREMQWQQVQLGAQQEAALHNQPPYVTDENGMLTYQYDPEYIARNYEVFDLRVYHRRCRTGFEETKDFPIRMNDLIAGRYQVMDFLGSAAFSRAIQALDVKTGMLVCLKIIKNNKDYFDQSLDEIKLLKFTNAYDPEDKHNIVRLYDFFYYKEHLFLVCELLRANLYEFQKYNRESGDAPYFTNACIQRIARQVLGSLEFLHSLGLIHSDLKPENILIKSYSRCEVKVIDLGSSCFTTDQLSSYVQSRSYRAPEVILGLPYDQKVDIWSLGCILAELSSGQVLFQNDSLATLLARLEGILGPVPEWMVQKGRYASRFYTRSGQLYERNPATDRYEMLIPKRTTLSHRVPDAHKGLVDFISYLLLVDPHKRPTASEALQHPFMQEDYYNV
eukprot:CAMPEP_0202359942 /NCGR_PEP_ID=MMETSP1126-20121109/13064_1 /ASSEMBLY_ACC=CAM_ASM_000457 /TAXON_ID=3047 /ORGANISM="Dunaliella tertiolecta, Strain CCMP1320" /LENGTH=1262 /DNA_ID=CAMNT_0048953517 /DNA_START=67 /DNA_END=3855 /DNA_ORIENTATION=-